MAIIRLPSEELKRILENIDTQFKKIAYEMSVTKNFVSGLRYRASRFLIEIPGEPIPWARPGQNKKRRFDTQDHQKHTVGAWTKSQMKISKMKIFKGPLCVSFQFRMPIPKYKEKDIGAILKVGGISLHIVPPDTDNLIKFYGDALNGILWKDDCLICSLCGEKRYSLKPATVIEVSEL